MHLYGTEFSWVHENACKEYQTNVQSSTTHIATQCSQCDLNKISQLEIYVSLCPKRILFHLALSFNEQFYCFRSDLIFFFPSLSFVIRQYICSHNAYIFLDFSCRPYKMSLISFYLSYSHTGLTQCVWSLNALASLVSTLVYGQVGGWLDGLALLQASRSSKLSSL